MAKVTQARRQEFNEKIKPYKDKIDAALKKEKELQTALHDDSVTNAYIRIKLSELMIYISTVYVAINNLSVEFLDVKNNDSLNDARKILYKAIIYLEEIVTDKIDVQYSEIEDKVASLAKMPIDQRFELVKKLGLAIQLLIDAFGDNTKWKWSFVEINGRFATVAKNLLDLKQACKDYLDPGSDNYDTTVYYIRLIKKLLDQSGTAYRDRYEFSTHRLDDMRLGINYVLAYRRICMLTGEKDVAEEAKRKAIVWKDKMTADKKKGLAS